MLEPVILFATTGVWFCWNQYSFLLPQAFGFATSEFLVCWNELDFLLHRRFLLLLGDSFHFCFAIFATTVFLVCWIQCNFLLQSGGWELHDRELHRQFFAGTGNTNSCYRRFVLLQRRRDPESFFAGTKFLHDVRRPGAFFIFFCCKLFFFCWNHHLILLQRAFDFAGTI